MKNLSRILSVMLCFAPFACANAAGTVATTAGSNLTAFNPSNANNNQWATMSNGRYDSNTTAKADFGNCNSLILRCAQPKCSNGGCSDISVASAIVKGCVQSNKSCAQYGDDLVQYMSAQLVANSNAKINEQNAAAQQAAAVAAQQQSQQQMQQMQQQMQQMQQQMAQQQYESQQQLQSALAQQAAQSQAALESMKSAATAAAMENEAGISAYQQDAINRGISADVLERQKITGQIMTEIENAETSLKEVKVAMNTAFEYAGCDARGNNCSGPKRIKKWRELAKEFLTPYDNAIDKLYDALKYAQLAGVNLSDIYMMLNNSCNSWGQYMCPRMEGGQIVYTDENSNKKGVPEVCTSVTWGIDENCENTCNGKTGDAKTKCMDACPKYKTSGCQPCTLLKLLSNGEDVYAGWVDADYSTDSGNTTVVACASGALDSSALFARRTKNKNGAGLVDIDKMDTWLTQNEPRKTKGVDNIYSYCNVNEDGDGYENLEKAMLSRVIPKNSALCVGKPGEPSHKEDEDCPFISPVYAICDTHPYNVGQGSASKITTANTNDCDETEREAFDSNAVWAEKENGECKVSKFCKNKYKVVGKKCIEITDEDEWEEYKKTSEYIDALNNYNRHVSAQFGEMKEVIALKTTVISQQMYKQYEYLNATIRRLKTQLEKAVLTANLQAAGAKDDSGSSSGLLGGGSSKSSQYRDCSGKNMQGTLDCLRENYSSLASQVNNKKCDKNAQKQLDTDIDIMNSILGVGTVAGCPADKSGAEKCKSCLQNYNGGMIKLDREIANDEARRNGRYYEKD